MEFINKIIVLIKKLIPDVLAVVGAVLISYGFLILLKPLGFIVGGCFFVLSAYIWSKAA